MAISVKQLVRRHGALVSAVTALWVTLAVVLLRLAGGAHPLAVYPALASAPRPPPYPFLAALAAAALGAVPFGIGFFLSLWLVAPIAEELRVGHVITRAVLATGIGATVAFIVYAVFALLGALTFTGALFANSFPVPAFDGATAAGALADALTGALLTLVKLLPLGVLAGVLLWLWRKDHPPRHPLSGFIDEV